MSTNISILYNKAIIFLLTYTAPTAPPVDVKILSVTSSNATISWMAPERRKINGKLLTYSVSACLKTHDTINNKVLQNVTKNICKQQYLSGRTLGNLWKKKAKCFCIVIMNNKG